MPRLVVRSTSIDDIFKPQRWIDHGIGVAISSSAQLAGERVLAVRCSEVVDTPTYLPSFTRQIRGLSVHGHNDDRGSGDASFQSQSSEEALLGRL